jgi:hypothetical protein
VTPADSGSPCALCSQPATVGVEPARRTLLRGPDPSDPSFSVTVLLPDIQLCAEHAFDVRNRTTLVGWCDSQRCRIYGEVDEASPCGAAYKQLVARKS